MPVVMLSSSSMCRSNQKATALTVPATTMGRRRTFSRPRPRRAPCRQCSLGSGDIAGMWWPMRGVCFAVDRAAGSGKPSEMLQKTVRVRYLKEILKHAARAREAPVRQLRQVDGFILLRPPAASILVFRLACTLAAPSCLHLRAESGLLLRFAAT